MVQGGLQCGERSAGPNLRPEAQCAQAKGVCSPVWEAVAVLSCLWGKEGDSLWSEKWGLKRGFLF